MKWINFLGVLFLMLGSFSFFAYASDEEMSADKLTLVAVGSAQLAKEKITINNCYVKDVLAKDQDELLKKLRQLFINDFAFYQKYFVVADASDKNFDDRKDIFFNNPSYDSWANHKTDYLLQMRAEKFGNRFKVVGQLFDIKKKTLLFKKEITPMPKTYRSEGHQMANEIYKTITGRDSIFTSKVLFVSDISSNGGKVIKELYLMDFDGQNVQQLTKHRGIVLSPSFSRDNRFILYSLIRDPKFGKRNVELHILDTETMKSNLISNREGINSGAIFLNDNEHIALTLSFTGNAEIYEMNVKTGALRAITKHFSDSVDPHLSTDGKTMAIISGRAGKAMLYTLDSTGTEKEVKRISYVGHFHATPVYSPDGKYIVFSSWVDSCFDLYRIDPTGGELVRLTRNFGCNENPSFSNDSEFIVFSNQRVITRKDAEYTLYIMDKDGEIIAPISKGLGRCTAPRWSN